MASYSAIPTEEDGREDRPASVGSSRGRRSYRGKNVGIVGQATWTSSVINLVNTILGAGLLAMPRAMSQMGMFLGTLIIVWAGLTAAFGLYLQARCAKYIERGSSSFAALSKLTYPNAAVVFDAAIAIKCFGVAVSYLIIIGDLMPQVVKGFHPGVEGGFLGDRQFWVTAFMLIVIPLSFLRRLDSLKYTSIVALVSIAYLVVLVLGHFFKGDTLEERGNVRVFTWAGPVQTLAVLPVIIFAYTCHQNMFAILNEIADNSHFRTTTVVVFSVGVSGLLYIVVAITGYLSYGDNVNGNIVSMYAPSAASTIGRLAIVILVMFSYPLQIHPCRASTDAVIRWRPIKSNRPSNEGSPSRGGAPLLPSGKPSAPQREDMSDLRFAILSTILIVASYILAMTVTSLEMVLAYVGSTGSTAISFILPGLFYYKISAPGSPHHQRLLKENDDEEDFESEGEDDVDTTGFSVRKLRHWRKDLLRKLSLALAIYGIVIMVVCLAMNTLFIAAH